MKNKKIISGILASVMAVSASAMPVITGIGMIPVAAASTEDNVDYDGEIKIWGEVEGEVKAGSNVKVALYADSKGSTLLGFELRAVFDTSKLEIEKIEEDTGFFISPSINTSKGVYAFASTSGVKNDPTVPFATITFKISDTFKSGDEITVNYEGANGYKEPVALKASTKDGETFYKPVVTPTVIKDSSFLPGDTNLNGEYDLQDAILDAKFLLGNELTEEQQTVGDYNQNGEIDLQDAIGVAKELLKK